MVLVIAMLRRHSVAIRLVVELQVVLRQEAEFVGTSVSERTDPVAFICKAADNRTGLCTQMSRFNCMEVGHDPVDREVPRLLEVAQVLVIDSNGVVQWLWQG